MEKQKKYLTLNQTETFFGTLGTIQYNLIQYKNVYTGLPHWHSHFSWGPVNK